MYLNWLLESHNVFKDVSITLCGSLLTRVIECAQLEVRHGDAVTQLLLAQKVTHQ